jgi:hypothetical protein
VGGKGAGEGGGVRGCFDGYEKVLSATNADELRAELERVVPQILGMESGARTKRNMELWVMREFLTLRANSDKLSFPLTLFAGDRPDIGLVEGNDCVGFEVAQLIHPQTAKLRQVAHKAGIQIYSTSGTARSQSELPCGGRPMLAVIQKDPMVGSLYLGNEVETEMAILVSEAVRAKIVSLNKSGFRYFNRNCLLLYNNAGLPLLNWQAVDMVAIREMNAHSTTLRFDQISIVTGQTLIELY